MSVHHLQQLKNATLYYPAIDNHTHPLLQEDSRDKFPFEGLFSEAQGDALTEDSINTVASYRGTRQLAELFGCENTWEAVKNARSELSYLDLCRLCMRPTGIQCLLVDDGLDTLGDVCAGVPWHDQFFSSQSRRIVRIEVEAQTILKALVQRLSIESATNGLSKAFENDFTAALEKWCQDSFVAGFKSIACYRTGLNIGTSSSLTRLLEALDEAVQQLRTTGKLRLAFKELNDWLVRKTLEFAGRAGKPVQFHTGLGDNDIMLADSNPALMQPIIKAYPNTKIVLLHASYPFTQEAGYLTSVYKNVYFDFGEIFPFVSADGQRTTVGRVLELCPTNKIMWSSDGHFWPESYYLGTLQAREALYDVLADFIARGDMTESQAVKTVENALFHNANRIYNLGLDPHASISATNSATNALTIPSGGPNIAKVEFVRVSWVDFTSTIMCQILPLQHFKRITAKDGSGISLTKSCMGLVFGDMAPGFDATGEYMYVPDMSSFRPCGFEDGMANVYGWFRESTANGLQDSPLCPRAALRNAVRYAKDNFDAEFLVGFESEFILLSSTDPVVVAGRKYHSWSRTSATYCGSVESIALKEMVRAIQKVGIIVEAYHAEAAPGQFEIVTGPLPPLQAVDALIATREAIFNIANEHGLRATFAPKIKPKLAGTAAHAHISIKSPRTFDLTPYNIDSGNQLSGLEASFLQGILSALPALCAFTLPVRASYGRVADNTWSGGTYVCWGRENREAPLRLCGEPGNWHFEIKALDGIANPYLALAAVLYTGIGAIDRKEKLTVEEFGGVAVELSEERRRDLGIVQRMPLSSDLAREALTANMKLQGLMGRELVDKYLSVNKKLNSLLGDPQLEESLSKLVESY